MPFHWLWGLSVSVFNANLFLLTLKKPTISSHKKLAKIYIESSDLGLIRAKNKTNSLVLVETAASALSTRFILSNFNCLIALSK